MNNANKKNQSKLLISITTIFFNLIVTPLWAGTPFNCSTDAYIVHSTPGRFTPSNISAIDIAKVTNTLLENGFHSTSINAIGYNVSDNYIWGYDKGNEKIIRIDSNFDVTTYNIPNLPKNRYIIGDVSLDGILYLGGGPNKEPNKLFKVDVNPSSPTYLKYLGAVTFSNGYETTANDFAVHPGNGMIYLPNRNNGHLMKINPANGQVTDIGDMQINGYVGSNATFFDADGYYYINDKQSATGAIYRIDLTDPAAPNPKGEFFSVSVIPDQADGARCPNAKLIEGSVGNGTLRYANSGTGQYKDRILFMDWKNSSLEDGIQDNDVVNFTIPASTGIPNGILTATFTNVDDPSHLANGTRPSSMQTWGGAPFYQLYDTSGSGEAIYTPDYVEGVSDKVYQHLSFDVTWTMTVNGQVVSPDIFLIDAESTAFNTEQIEVTTNGGIWSIIENAVNDSYIVEGVGTHQILITDTEDLNIDYNHPTSTEGSPLLFSKGATEISITMRWSNATGREAVAFALLVPTDHSDATDDYGDAFHAFKEEAISPSKSQLGLKFTTGTPYFGTPPDSESATQEDENGVAGQGDDSHKDAFDTTRDDDEDIEIVPLVIGRNTEIVIPVTGSGYLQAWIDWNADGDFNDAGEQVANNMEVNGDTTLSLNAPTSAEPGPSYARFRISTQQNLAAAGYAKDGEVEDVAISISDNVCRVNDLSDSLYSTSSVSANSNTLSDSTRVYQAKFDNTNWEGHILSYELETTEDDGGVKSSSSKWDASNMSRAGRHVFSYNPSASNRGISFQWDQFNTQQKSLLIDGHDVAWGENLMGWVMGEVDNEGTDFRARTSILGDIINSNLLFKDTLANYGYSRLPEGSNYPAFLSSKKDTTPTIFVGANDGMLHAFNGNDGNELFAYVPNEVFSKLPTISDKQYGCKTAGCLPHEYLVDGKSAIGDAYFASSSDWHTVLIGGLGLGGKALFALDVTNPGSFSANDVLWEISSTQAVSAGSDASEFTNHLGKTIPSASIVRINNTDSEKQWAAVIGNGYESTNHQAVLFIIDIKTGALIKKINTNSGSEDQPNGLSTPVAIDSDNDSIVDRIYAGDLLGNLWAFDVSGNNPDNWGVDFTGTPLFSTSKAITAPPQVGKNKLGGLMVYFGTGKYFDVGDNMYENAPVSNTYYGIHDNGSPVSADTLVEQQILQQEAANGTDYNTRVISNNPVNFSTDHGWYMNLPDAGERVISQALLRVGRLIFTTMTPPGNICEWGGTSWLMEFNAVDGTRLAAPPLDINNDKEFTAADNVEYQNEATVISGIQDRSLGVVFSTPAVITHTNQREGKYLAGSGGIGMIRESASSFSGRMSWRQIR